MKINNFILFFVCLTFLFSCSEKQQEKNTVTILVQPFKDIKPENVQFVINEIKKVYPNVKILQPIDFPENAYYKERNRYRADSIIKFLDKKTKNGFITSCFNIQRH
ncbi:hypothetical protein [Chryseobacterium wanjuense]